MLSRHAGHVRAPRVAAVITSDAASRLRQTGVFARLLGRAVREQLVQVLAGALVGAELLADRLGQHAHGRSNLVFLVVFAQEVDHFPMARGQLAVVDLGHFRANFLVPVGAVDEIAFLVDFHGLARYGNRAHVLSPVKFNVDLLHYSQDWTVGYSAARSTNPA